MLKKILLILSVLVLVLVSSNLLFSANTRVVNAESSFVGNPIKSNEEVSLDDELKLNEPIVIDNTKAELIESSEGYTKIKITNLEDNSEEFIEEFTN